MVMEEAKQDYEAKRRKSSELIRGNDIVYVIVQNAQSERTTESFDEPSHRHAEEHELTQYFGGRGAARIVGHKWRGHGWRRHDDKWQGRGLRRHGGTVERSFVWYRVGFSDFGEK